MEPSCPAPAIAAPHKRQFVSLEWLRFFLGVYLVLFHTLNGFNYPELPVFFRKFFEMGFFSTSTFFVLSGFLLAHVYLRDHASGSALMSGTRKSFWVKRFANLYPIHLGSFLLVVAIFAIFPKLGIIPNDKGMSLMSVYPDTNDWKAAVMHRMSSTELGVALGMHALLLHAWNPFYLTFNMPSWSISTLMFLYLLFPMVAPYLHRFKHPGRVLTAICLLYLVPVLLFICMDWYGSPATGILHRNPLIRMPEFLAGIALCAVYHRQQQMGKVITKWVLVGLWGFVIASVLIAAYLLNVAGDFSQKGNIPYFLLHDGLLLPAQLALIYVLLHVPNPSERWAKLAKPLGNCSLSMFALHIPLFMIFVRIERVIDGEPSLCLTDLMGCFAAAGGKTPWHYPIYFLLVVLISLAFQKHFVERCRALIERSLLTTQKKNAPTHIMTEARA
ncbi:MULTISPECIES: acyltransferase family protein [Pseudomonas]|uniref:acyltransferase family protein n=1 Tax=Pseudomonas TaxID=286 RepID=UPI000F02F351|nr:MULTISPECIES: acyltransferase [Pseudomonas]MBD8614848.1 acyltransferase [Pseudomonas putida]MBD8681468.1 acyltransferase [Pseudomonas sp. CFBP 13719]